MKLIRNLQYWGHTLLVFWSLTNLLCYKTNFKLFISVCDNMILQLSTIKRQHIKLPTECGPSLNLSKCSTMSCRYRQRLDQKCEQKRPLWPQTCNLQLPKNEKNILVDLYKEFIYFFNWCKKCKNLTLKVNFLRQKLSESF